MPYRLRLRYKRLLLSIIITSLSIQHNHVYANRMQIKDSDENLPYLAIENENKETGPVVWSQPLMLSLITQNHFVELSNRGLRGIKRKLDSEYIRKQIDTHSALRTHCSPAYEALCMIKERDSISNESSLSYILPSPSLWKNMEKMITRWNAQFGVPIATHLSQSVEIVSAFNSKIENEALKRLVVDSKHACSSKGQGRKFNDNNTRTYTVTACDILYGHTYLIYDIQDETLIIFNETFGEMAYFILLVTCIICLYSISEHMYNEPQNLNVSKILFASVNISTSLSLCLCYAIHGFPFASLEDEFVFFCSVSACVICTVLSLTWDCSYGHDASMFNISSICISIYKTCENPYTFFFVFGMSIQAWKCILKTCNCSNTSQNTDNSKYKLLINLSVYIGFLCTLTEYGIKPTFENREEDWVVYSSIAMFISFHLCIFMRFDDNEGPAKNKSLNM